MFNNVGERERANSYWGSAGSPVSAVSQYQWNLKPTVRVSVLTSVDLLRKNTRGGGVGEEGRFSEFRINCAHI